MVYSKHMKTLLFLSLLLASPLSAEVYELRTYTPNEGKMEDLLTRFRDHTTALFEKHGMRNVGYWLTGDGEGQKLVYIVAHKDRESAKESWTGFRNDPDWKAAYKASIADGKIVQKIDKVYMTPTDFSKLQ